jgi:arsenate reductase
MDPTKYKLKVLSFDLENCTGSQMAEADLRYLAGDIFEAFSAGLKPHELSPAAVLAMDEKDIDISRQYFKNVEEYSTFHFKFVITLCELARSRCALFRFAENFRHWDFPNNLASRGPLQAELEGIRGFRGVIEYLMREFIFNNSLSSSGHAIVKK